MQPPIEFQRNVESPSLIYNKDLTYLKVMLAVSIIIMLAATIVVLAFALNQYMPTAITSIINSLSPFAYNAIFISSIAAGEATVVATAGISYMLWNQNRKDPEVHLVEEEVYSHCQ